MRELLLVRRIQAFLPADAHVVFVASYGLFSCSGLNYTTQKETTYRSPGRAESKIFGICRANNFGLGFRHLMSRGATVEKDSISSLKAIHQN